jgi:hypothetical protein
MIEFLKGLIININLKYPYTLKEKTKKVWECVKDLKKVDEPYLEIVLIFPICIFNTYYYNILIYILLVWKNMENNKLKRK